MRTVRRSFLVGFSALYLCALMGWTPTFADGLLSWNSSGNPLNWRLQDESYSFGAGNGGTVPVQGLPAKWSFNSAGTNDVTGNNEFLALKKGMIPWVEVNQSQYMGVYAGLTSENSNRLNSADNEAPINAVYFTNTSGSGTLAVSRSIFLSGSNAYLINNDIQFYDSGISWSASGESGKYDIQSVMTHEYGHSIGFDHSSFDGALNVNGGTFVNDGSVVANGTSVTTNSSQLLNGLGSGDFIRLEKVVSGFFRSETIEISSVSGSTITFVQALSVTQLHGQSSVELVGYDADSTQSSGSEDTMDTNTTTGQTSQQTLASNDIDAVQTNYPSTSAHNIAGVIITSVDGFDLAVDPSEQYGIDYRWQNDDDAATLTFHVVETLSNDTTPQMDSNNQIGSVSLSSGGSGATNSSTGTFFWDGTGGGATPGTSYHIVAKIVDGSNTRYDVSAGTLTANNSDPALGSPPTASPNPITLE